MLPILAYDPGSRRTGLVVRRDDDLLAWSLEVRKDNGRLPDGRYVRQILHAGSEALRKAGVDPAARDTYVVGAEGIAWWPSEGKRRNETHLYGTAVVIGGILARWPQTVIVDSGRGVAALHRSAYPDAIRPPVTGKGTDRLVHVRAAFDHSHAVETEWKRR